MFACSPWFFASGDSTVEVERIASDGMLQVEDDGSHSTTKSATPQAAGPVDRPISRPVPKSHSAMLKSTRMVLQKEFRELARLVGAASCVVHSFQRARIEFDSEELRAKALRAFTKPFGHIFLRPMEDPLYA